MMKRWAGFLLLLFLFLLLGQEHGSMKHGEPVPEKGEIRERDEAEAAKLGRGKQTITMEGSTSVAALMEVLADMFMEKRRDVRVDIMANGTQAAIKAVSQGNADLGMLSRALWDNEKTRDMKDVQIAWDALAVIVHPLNPVNNLTKSQISGIYSGDITHWRDLNGDETAIHIISREAGSGTQAAFMTFFELDEITEGAQISDGNGSVIAGVAGKTNAIGYVSFSMVPKQVKAISIDAVSASWENVYNETYALKRPFFLIYKTDRYGELTRDFMAFIQSEEAWAVISKNYVPVHFSSGVSKR